MLCIMVRKQQPPKKFQEIFEYMPCMILKKELTTTNLWSYRKCSFRNRTCYKNLPYSYVNIPSFLIFSQPIQQSKRFDRNGQNRTQRPPPWKRMLVQKSWRSMAISIRANGVSLRCPTFPHRLCPVLFLTFKIAQNLSKRMTMMERRKR